MYKKIVALFTAGIFAVGVVGCATVQVEAPAGSDIKLAPVNSTPTRVVKKRVFYALWGLVPITPNSTAPMLNGQSAKEVKIKTYEDPIDYIITAVLGIVTITSRTVEIQMK